MAKTILEELEALRAENPKLKEMVEKLTAENKELSEGLDKAVEAAVAETESRLKQAEATIAEMLAEFKGLTDDLDAAKKAIDELKSKDMSADRRAATIARSMCGAPIDKDLTTSSDAETLDEVRVQLRVETNPVRKRELVEKCRELRGHAGLFARN